MDNPHPWMCARVVGALYPFCGEISAGDNDMGRSKDGGFFLACFTSTVPLMRVGTLPVPRARSVP